MDALLEDLSQLYEDSKTCARLVGLSYISDEMPGLSRKKHGKGFSYVDTDNRVITDAKLKARLSELIIPPAWKEVWICPDDKGHILATGIDDKGRKQYIYHPKWRTMRDLIKFYRMLIFGASLPAIRTTITDNLQRPELDREKVLAIMLWLLDNSYIRIGNEQYYEENESVGLTTLTDKNVVVAGPVTTLSFIAKSGKPQQITFDDAQLSAQMQQLRQHPGERLFRYQEGGDWKALESDDINHYLHDISGVHISAKDFRTWGGTLMAFNHLIETEKLPDEETPKPEKAVVQAVDAAANVLGNTRSVAKSSYVHPHLLSTYGTKNFRRYYETASQQRKKPGLDKRETELLHFLEQLFEEEFTLLKQKSD